MKKHNIKLKKFLPIFYTLIFVLLFRFLFVVVQVSGTSMSPTLSERDFGVVSKRAYSTTAPKKGDIVCVNYKDKFTGETVPIVKRVIGVPGDHILVENGSVYIDGILINEELYINSPYTSGEVDLVVPRSSYFVMGDNRDHSLDSRSSMVGVVLKRNIIGKFILRLWPNTQSY